MPPVAVESTQDGTAKQERVAKVLQVSALILVAIEAGLIFSCWMG